MLASRASLPTATLPAPEVFSSKALQPIPVLLSAVVTFDNAFAPTAVFCEPVVLDSKASLPSAVFELPVVWAVKAFLPTATLLEPVVIASPANSPILVFKRASPTSILPLLNVAIPAIPVSYTHLTLPTICSV